MTTMNGGSADDTLSLIVEDWRANPRDYKARFVLVGFRLAQATLSSRATPWPLKFLAVASYRFVTEWILGIELRPKTVVGGGLRLYHGVGIVVNDHTVLGRNVILRTRRNTWPRSAGWRVSGRGGWGRVRSRGDCSRRYSPRRERCSWCRCGRDSKRPKQCTCRWQSGADSRTV